MNKKLAIISKFLLIFVLIAGWLFSGWPRIWEKPAIPPKIQEVWAAQFGRPISDVSTGTWTTAPLYAKIDEPSYDDGDYVTSRKNATDDTFEVMLSTLTDPATSVRPHLIRYRARNESAGHTVAIYLMQGATQIATYNPTLTTSFATYTYTLTSTEADNITNYADLRLKFVGNTTAAKYVHVSWAEFEVPDLVIVSVSVSDGIVTYGTMVAGTSKTTIDLSDTQTLTNDGNVTETFNIKGQNASCPWTLASTAGTDQYVHQFCKATDVSCVSPPINYTALTTGYVELYTSVAPSATRQLDLRITVPTESSCFTSQAVDVTIQATQ